MSLSDIPPIVTDALTAADVQDPLRAMAPHILVRLPLGVVIQRPDGSIVDANDAACRILRLSMDQLCGRTSMDPTWRAVRADGSPLPGEEHPAMRTLRTGQHQAEVMGVHTPTGEVAWIDVEAQPVLGPDGTTVGVFSTFTDITAEHDAHDREVRTRLRYERMATEASDVRITLDTDGHINYATPSTVRILGREPDEMLGTSVLDLLDDADRHTVAEMTTSVTARPGATDRRTVRVAVRGDGRRWFELQMANLLDDPAIEGVLITFVDVDDRVAAEEQLQRVNLDLERRLAELDRSHRLEGVLSATAELLQRCEEPDEVAAVVWDCMTSAFSDGSVSLHMASDGFGLLHPAHHRGDDAGPVRLEDCWAARTKRVHLNRPDGLQCDHRTPGDLSACIPLVADGQVVALAMVEGAGLDADELDQLATLVGSRVSASLRPTLVTMLAEG